MWIKRSRRIKKPRCGCSRWRMNTERPVTQHLPCALLLSIRGLAEITAMNCWGPNDFNTYSIDQLEPLMMLMKAEPDQVMWLDGERWMTLVVQFRDGRSATVSCFGTGSPFVTNIGGKNKSKMVTVESDFFREFIKELCRFYQTGEIQVPHEDTISIMAVRGAGLRAQQTPGVWVKV